MSDQQLMFIDIVPKSNTSAPAHSSSGKPLWTRSDNSFKFQFLPDASAHHQEEPPPSSDRTEPTSNQITVSGSGSAFAFNFQIPPVENMDTTDSPDTPTPSSTEEKLVTRQEVSTLPESSNTKKKKKKKNKKSEDKKPSDSSEPQQKQSSAEGGQNMDTELSAEEQLNRQLDWCIEQLELGMKSQKSTPKQREEASRSLKTLRSSKAPLAKKRQVMRAMTGDYRKKMEDEKIKQHKLIQSEIASARVKVVSESPKTSVFHRRAEVKTHTASTEKNLQQTEATEKELLPQTQDTPAFVFTPSQEEFRFNFL